MRKVLVALFVVLMTALVPAIAWGQAASEQMPTEEVLPTIKDNSQLQLALVHATQNPDTKDITYELLIYSQIASDRVQVSWRVTGNTQLITPSNTPAFSMAKDSVRRVKVTVRPRSNGLSNIAFTVQIFEARGTVVSTANQDIFTTRDGTVFPVTPSYQTLQFVGIARSVAQAVLTLALLVFGLYILYRIFSRWLNPPETPIPLTKELWQSLQASPAVAEAQPKP